MTEAEKAGIAGDLVVMMGSDFARGPGYNADNQYGGKDHWSITSAMLMGRGIAGDRVVGATTDDQLARAIDPGSLGLADGGKVLKPETIHLALRKLARATSSPGSPTATRPSSTRSPATTCRRCSAASPARSSPARSSPARPGRRPRRPGR
jgi:hypothetical protein